MDKLIITDSMRNGIKGAVKSKIAEPTEECKKICEETNQRIRENRRREAEAWIHASTYISD